MPTKATSIGFFAYDRAEPPAFGLWVVFTIHIMERLERQRQQPVETLPEVFAKRGRMRDRQADVFIEMKRRHAIPCDILLANQGGQHFKLRSAGRNDDRRRSGLA